MSPCARFALCFSCLALLRCDGEKGSQQSPTHDAGRDAGAALDAGPKRDAGARAGAGGAAGTRRDAALEDAEVAPQKPEDAAVADAADDGPDAHVDAGGMDASADGGVDPEPDCTPFVMPEDCAPSGTALPAELRCTGLYADFATRELACGVLDYAPAFELWSDGAEKHRFVALPPGTHVDVSDPDAFVFPVGTQLWKEFRVRNGDSGPFRLGETRLLRKLENGWAATTYVWSEDERTALARNDGVTDLYGTGHRVPTRDQCVECHGGRKDFVLGWDGVMLGSGASGRALEVLPELIELAGGAGDEDAGAERGYAVPGDAIERAALGYLHANCGVSCHNPTADARARDTGLYLRLEAGALASVAQTPAFTTGINKLPAANAPIQELPPPPGDLPFYDLRPGDPARSLVLARMRVRQNAAQMPRIATERVDAAGVALVQAWIEHMPELPAYPAPAP
jgi:hypothetical protein